MIQPPASGAYGAVEGHAGVEGAHGMRSQGAACDGARQGRVATARYRPRRRDEDEQRGPDEPARRRRQKSAQARVELPARGHACVHVM